MTRALAIAIAATSLAISTGLADETIPNGEGLDGRYGGLVYQGDATDLAFYDAFRDCSDRVDGSADAATEDEARESFADCMVERGYERVDPGLD